MAARSLDGSLHYDRSLVLLPAALHPSVLVWRLCLLIIAPAYFLLYHDKVRYDLVLLLIDVPESVTPM